jgi:hypothetical protein
MTSPLQIRVVLIFRDPGETQRLGALLRTALREVETLYNIGSPRIRLSRYVMCDSPLTGYESDWQAVNYAVKTWQSIFGGASPWKTSPDEPWNAKKVGTDLWESSGGAYAGTLDPEKLLGFVRNTADIGEEEPLLVVVDQKITPPSNMVYLVAKSYGPREDQTIVSTVTMDPLYWNVPDANPLATIKQRFRAICLAFVGELLHLGHCSEPACFMYALTDNPETLDGMVRMGLEHNLPDLAGKGYAFPPSNPAVVQPVLDNPQPKGWQALA